MGDVVRVPDNGDSHRYDGCSISTFNRGTTRLGVLSSAESWGAKFRWMPSSAISPRGTLGERREAGVLNHVQNHVN